MPTQPPHRHTATPADLPQQHQTSSSGSSGSSNDGGGSSSSSGGSGSEGGSKAVVKVWCMPLDKVRGGSFSWRCKKSKFPISANRFLLAQDRVVTECGLQDVTIKAGVGGVGGVEGVDLRVCV